MRFSRRGRSVGNEPEKLLLRASKRMRFFKEETPPFGKGPEKLFRLMSRLLRVVMLKISCGNSPEKELSLMLSSTRSVKTRKRVPGRFPERVLEERLIEMTEVEFWLHRIPDQEQEGTGLVLLLMDQSCKVLELSVSCDFKVRRESV